MKTIIKALSQRLTSNFMSLSYRKYIVLAAVFTNLVANAQNNITGKVVEKNSTAVPFANVALYQVGTKTLVRGEVTDVEGTFKFDNMKVGEYSIVVSFIGFKKFEKTISVIENQNTDLGKIEMENEATALKEVKVVSKKPFIERKDDRFIVNVENSIVGSGHNVIEVVERAPGVSLDNNDNLSVLGRAASIMVDGRPLQLSGESLKNYLRGLKSDNIATIEIITQPSAKYDASRGAIINIKTKKGTIQGLNASINSSITQNEFTKYSGGTSFNYKGKKVNFFGNYDYTHSPNWRTMQEESFFSGKTNSVLFTNGRNVNKPVYNSGRVGLDYYLNKNHVLGATFDGSLSNTKTTQNSDTEFLKNSSAVADSILKTTGNRQNDQQFYSYNLNYKGTLDSLGKTLELNFDSGKDDYNFESSILGEMYQKKWENPRFIEGLQNLPNSLTQYNIVKADYTHPLKKGKNLEIGAKYSSVSSLNDIKTLIQAEENNTWLVDKGRTNEFNYKENISSAYINFAGAVGKVFLMAGLRIEKTDAEINSITENKLVKRNYTNAFPNLMIQKSLNKKHQMTIGVSRMIGRPTYDYLNPFAYYTSKYNFTQGNPYLKPTTAYALILSHSFNNKVYTNMSYAMAKDLPYETFEQIQETKTTRHFYTNLNKFRGINLNINVPIHFSKKWQASNNINFNYGKVSDPNFLGQSLSITNKGVFANSVHTISLPKGFTGDITAYYGSPMQQSTITQLSNFYLNMGVQKSIWEKKANMKLTFNDVFRTRRYAYEANFSTQNQTGLYLKDTQFVRFSFTYKLGKSVSVRQRKSGGEEEKGRINRQ